MLKKAPFEVCFALSICLKCLRWVCYLHKPSMFAIDFR